MADQRRGLGLGEVTLVVVALIVMTGFGIATASAFTGSGEPDVSLLAVEPAPSTSLEPVTPQAEAVAPVASGATVASEWVTSMAVRAGISEVAVEAYGAATLRLGREQPACQLGWTTLAGIGGIESGHGTNGGSFLLPDGQTSQPILGPALDGTNGNGAIRATAESTQWHGDAEWDHAVGPMQFIPSTWERWESDGNDDGVADPSNVFDAAYAAGRYLCASGADLRTGQGWSRAIFSYNHSDDYVRSVLAFANYYAKAS